VWDEADGTHEETVTFPFRYLFRYELEHLLVRANLRIEMLYGDFYGHSLDETQKEFVVICRK